MTLTHSLEDSTPISLLIQSNRTRDGKPGARPGVSVPHWSEEEISILKNLTSQGVSFEGIANALNRSPNAVYQKIIKMKLPHKSLTRVKKKRNDQTLTTVNLRVDRDFAIRLSLFAADFGYSRSVLIEEVMERFMNQVESSE